MFVLPTTVFEVIELGLLQEEGGERKALRPLFGLYPTNLETEVFDFFLKLFLEQKKNSFFGIFANRTIFLALRKNCISSKINIRGRMGSNQIAFWQITKKSNTE